MADSPTTLEASSEPTTSMVFTVASGKGGVGKTTSSINLGAALTNRDRSTIVVEADMSMANVVDFLRLDIDFTEGDPNLHTVLAGEDRIRSAIYESPGGMDVIPSGVDLESYADADPSALERVIEWLRPRYEAIILDTRGGVGKDTLIPLGLADRVLVVSSPRVASVRDTKKTVELTHRVNGNVTGVIFTRSGTGSAPPAAEIADFIGVELLGHVPEDETIPQSQDAGMPIVNYRPESPAAEAYDSIAATVDTWIEESRHTEGFLFDQSSSDTGEGVLTDGSGNEE